jgi:NAD(P) transhydrogenase subunit alpha
LAGLKVQLIERVRVIEDLQHQAQVQRESAVLLAQRIEVLSTKPWQDAQALVDALGGDIAQWQSQASALMGNPQWPSVDLKFAPILDTARAQLLLVWEAFQAALAQAVAAAADPFLFLLTIFLLACFVGYYVVWNVTPALHSPLMGVTNAISSVIVVGAILAAGTADNAMARIFGFLAVTLAAVNIFGGFLVTRRMLAMFQIKKKG